MCRLAYIRERPAQLSGWLAQMEKSAGGDGNGVVLAKRAACTKGVKVALSETVDIIQNSAAPALWHTRRVSSGIKSDDLCHPFQVAGGWMVHNGHWWDGDRASSILRDATGLGPVSDTRLFSMVADRRGFRIACLDYRPQGVWLWMNPKGKLSVWKNGGSLWYNPELKTFGSETDGKGYWYEVADGWHSPKIEPRKMSAKLPPVKCFLKDESDWDKDWVGDIGIDDETGRICLG